MAKAPFSTIDLYSGSCYFFKVEQSEIKLFLVSGKIASGKSTLAKKLADKNSALLICQDDWLAMLFPNEIHTLDDYVKYSTRLMNAMEKHVTDILKFGRSVVLDFPANTLKTRARMKLIGDAVNCKVEMHYLEAADDICLQRLKSRNELGDHQYKTNEEEFHLFTRHFVIPSSAEGFNLILHPSSQN